MVRGHHWWKKTTQHLKIDGHAHLQGQLLSYKRLDGAPPPSDRLTCWDEVTFYTERGAICCSFLLISTGNSDRFCCSTMEAKFGRVYPLRTIPWSERGDCRGRQPWIWILICRRSPWWAAKALESHLASTTKMRILLYSENQLMRPLKIGGVGWLVGIVCVCLLGFCWGGVGHGGFGEVRWFLLMLKDYFRPEIVRHM